MTLTIFYTGFDKKLQNINFVQFSLDATHKNKQANKTENKK